LAPAPARHPLTDEIYKVAEGLGWEMKLLKNYFSMGKTSVF
jgi:hypothetical protein